MDENLQQQVNAQLHKELRVGAAEENADLMRERIAGEDVALYDMKAMRQDISEIEKLLENKEGVLTDQQRAELEAIQGRNLSSLLILSEKTLGDSKEMKAVKKGIAAIERYLHNRKETSFTPDNVDYILGMYDTAILACNYYLDHKSPTFGTGKDRYRQVQYNMSRLMIEASDFRVARELLKSGVLAGKVNTARTAHDLMVQAKLYKLMPAGQERVEPEVREPATDEQVEELGFYGKTLFTALSGKVEPADLVAKLQESYDDKEFEFSKKLPVFMRHIVSTLRDFKENKVGTRMFVFENSVISLTQNAAGQVTLSVGNKSVPIERNSGVLADQIALNIVKNEKVYGKKAVEDIMQPIVKTDYAQFVGSMTSNMQMITSYLSVKTGYPASKFGNVQAPELFRWLNYAFDGSAKLMSEVKWAMMNDHDSEDVINGVETKELLKETMKEENREDVQQKVTIVKKEEKRDKTDWNENEQKVMNLLSELIFSYETWKADETKAQPGERIKQVLNRNADAVCLLIADMYSRGEDRMKMINGIVNRLPLFMLEEEEQIAQFRAMIEDSLKDVTDAIDRKIGEKIDDVLPEILEKRAEIKARKEERAKKKQEAGGFFGGGLFGMLGNLAEEVADNATDAMLAQVDTKEKILAQAVKHLSNPEALKEGGGVFKLPSIFDIIKEISQDELAEAESRIDDAVEDMTDEIQETVSKYSGELFKADKTKKKEEEVPDPNAPNLKDWERRNAQRKLIKIGNEKLENKIKECMSSGESGQGMFTKYVFNTYFGMVNTIDKRSMIAAMIKNSKPVTEKFEDEDEVGITDQVKKDRIAHNESIRARAMGNYLGGMLKGAGPLFQKMMQGLPIEGLPEELKSAVEDMKSKLAPIPEEVVEAQLYAIVQRSHKQIKNIKVIKPLGAASVGQTFLCKLTRADGKEDEVAVKLLKPDVKNRMMREKDVMLFCARMTDKDSRTNENRRRKEENVKRRQQGKAELEMLPEIKEEDKGGMQMTYEGQLERIEEELDLTIEARNVELGKIYDEYTDEASSKAVSMKLNPLVAPTTNSMVLEKAAGETIDSLLTRVKDEVDELMDLYYKKNDKGEVIREKNEDGVYEPVLLDSKMEAMTQAKLAFASDEYFEKDREFDTKYLIDQLTEKLLELRKKKKYLDAFTKKWVEEGIFKEGFYHGDPHAGNIMISDDKLTAIDFGNCTKLSEEQQEHVTRMIFAASVGDMKTFRSGFHALLNPRFESLYQEKRTELGRIISETFALGNAHSAGMRIMVAILRAQELGLEVPASVYNFAQGQMRLQNALTEFNSTIERVSKTLNHISKFRSANDSGFDFTDDCRESILFQTYDVALFRNMTAYGEDMLGFTANEKAIKSYAYHYPQQLKNGVANALKWQKNAINSLTEFLRGTAKLIPTISKKAQQFGEASNITSKLRSVQEELFEYSPEEKDAVRPMWTEKVNKIFEKTSEYMSDERRNAICELMENSVGDRTQLIRLNEVTGPIQVEMAELINQPENGMTEDEWSGLLTWRDGQEPAFEELEKVFGKNAVKKIKTDIENGNLNDEQIEELIEKMQREKEMIEEVMPKFDRLLEKRNEIERKHKNSFDPTDEENAKYFELLNDLLASYIPIQKKRTKIYIRYEAACDELIKRENRAGMQRDMNRFFAVHDYKKNEFMQAFTAFTEAQDSGLENTNPDQYNQIEQNLKDLYYDVMQRETTRKYSRTYDASNYTQINFADIMSEVISEQKGSSFSRLGLYKSVKYKIQVDNMTKENDKLSETEKEDKEAEAEKKAEAGPQQQNANAGANEDEDEDED